LLGGDLLLKPLRTLPLGSCGALLGFNAAFLAGSGRLGWLALFRHEGGALDELDETFARELPVMTSTPSLVRRCPPIRKSRIRTSSGSDGECSASKRSCTALATLLTFCPPAPDERMKLSSSSDSPMAMDEVMRRSDMTIV
jgi:hypothetical protein